jgi:N6-adenosine-specific RNA methylase IME4
MAPVGAHSEKPDVFYEIIEEHYPTLPKFEMFARRARDGWASWGNEAPEDEAAT